MHAGIEGQRRKCRESRKGSECRGAARGRYTRTAVGQLVVVRVARRARAGLGVRAMMSPCDRYHAGHGEKRVPPPNGGHGSLFPAVCRGAPIPIVMLSHTYGSTAMPCVCVDNLYHYHFIEEPRMRLPHPHLLAHECVPKSVPTLNKHTRHQRWAPCHSVDTIL